MYVRHQLEVVATCPVDKAGDVYEVTVVCRRVIMVEDILKAVADLNARPVTQEEFTARLHRALAARVRTRGYHSGVLTTVVCGEA